MNRRDFFGWLGRLLAALPFVTLPDSFTSNEIATVDLPDSEYGNSPGIISLMQTFKPPSNIWVSLYDPTETYTGSQGPNGYRPDYDANRARPGYYFPYSGDSEWEDLANVGLAIDAHEMALSIIKSWRQGVLFPYEAKLRAEKLGARVMSGYWQNGEM